MLVLHLLAMFSLAGAPGQSPAETPWQKVHSDDGITVSTRQRPGSDVTELQGTAEIAAPPAAVRKVILDYANYPRTMPYMDEARVLAQEEDGKTLYVYNKVAAPLIDKRDFIIKVVDVSDWKDGAGFLKVAWSVVPEGKLPGSVKDAPPPSEDVVRVRINDGYWLLEPRDGGKKTWATYYLFTDPGGAVPKWIVNRANTSAIPDIFKALRKVAPSN